MKLALIMIVMMAMIVVPSAVAEQKMLVSGSLTDTRYEITITESYYKVGSDGNIAMIVEMYVNPCYPFEAEARIDDDNGTIFFLADDLVEYHLLEVLEVLYDENEPSCMMVEPPSCENWKIFFKGNIVNGTTITFPNPDGKYGENLLGFPKLKEDLTLFLDERLMVVAPENASWKILVFSDEEKFVVYRR